MATPNQPGNPSEPWPGQPWYPGQPGQPYYPQPYQGNQSYGYHAYPTPGYAVDPYAPYGRDPATGLPLSDKSAVTAGLLQLFFGIFGVGRFYIGSTSIAVVQLCLGVVGFVFGVFCLIGLPVLAGVGIWALVDSIMMFTGGVPDNYGRKLH